MTDEELIQQLTRIEINQRAMHTKVDTICEVVTGNGTPRKGLIVRVDRLEQARLFRMWLSNIVVVAGVGAVISGAWAWMKSGGRMG